MVLIMKLEGIKIAVEKVNKELEESNNENEPI